MSVRPTVGSATEELYSALGPWAEQDTADETWGVLELSESVAARYQDLEDIIRDRSGGEPGWSIVMDVDAAPVSWLGWLGQFAGVRLRAGLTEEAQRIRVKSTDGFWRGTPSAFAAAAQQYLTGAKYVVINERVGGAAYQIGVLTKTSETPDPDLVEAALLEQKPAGLILTYSTVAFQTYQSVEIGFDTYQDVKNEYATYQDLRDNLP